jgi:hypothetical protein
MVADALAGGKKHLQVELALYESLVMSTYFLRSLVEVLLDCDPIFLRLRLADFWEVFETLLPLDPAQQVAVLKYWTAWPMARWLREDDIATARPAFLPKAQSTLDFPIRGSVRKHFRNMVCSRTTSTRAGILCNGLLQGVKRGCAPVPEMFEFTSCTKHKAALTVPVPFESDPQITQKFRAIWGKTRVKREGDALRRSRWQKVHLDRKVERLLKVPSNHASIESKRSEGGRIFEIQRLNRRMNNDDYVPGTIDVSDPPLLDMYNVAGKVYERRGWPMASYDRFLSLAALHTRGRHLRAEVALCSEPLKCRVITKGEALPYFVAQTFQKQMWKALQEVPAFQLTSTPVDASMLYGLELKTSDLDLPFNQWVSGDYSAATDGLSLDVNQSCLSAMLDLFQATPEESEICRKVLGCHKVSYPKKHVDRANGNLDPFLMQNGQLMGSVLSFPVLCVINLTAYWCALEEYTGRRFTKEQLPCLVNGDDILFKSNADFYEVWKKWISKVGFTLSLGKNYISPNFLTVNSESWLHRGGSTFKKLPFLNCGLLLQEADGPCKVPLRMETAERPLIPKLQWILDNCNNPVRAFDRIKHHWRRSIKIHTQEGFYNLCSPIELGGLGLRVPEQCRENFHFTAIQQLIAGSALKAFKDLEGQEVKSLPRNPLQRISIMTNRPHQHSAPTSVDRAGRLVLRHSLEPLRSDNEIRLKDPRASLRVAHELHPVQIPSEHSLPEYSLRHISFKRIAKAFRLEAKVTSPLTFDLEVRKQLTNWGPTDDASPPGLGRPGNIAEMATETSFRPYYPSQRMRRW